MNAQVSARILASVRTASSATLRSAIAQAELVGMATEYLHILRDELQAREDQSAEALAANRA